MGVFFGGMSAAQTQHPTDAMMRSGRVLIVRRANIFRPPDHEHITVNLPDAKGRERSTSNVRGIDVAEKTSGRNGIINDCAGEGGVSVRYDRRCRERYRARPHCHRDGRRRSRKRRRSRDGGGEGDAGGGQFHGEARARSDLRADFKRARGTTRLAAHGGAEPRNASHRFHGLGGCGARRDHWNQRAGSGRDDFGNRESKIVAERSRATRSRFSAARQRWRRVAPHRSHGGGGRSCAHGRAATGRSALRNSARRRNDGALAGADGVSQKTRIAHVYDPKLDRTSARQRKASRTGAGDKIANRVRRFRFAFVSVEARRRASSRSRQGQDRQGASDSGARA